MAFMAILLLCAQQRKKAKSRAPLEGRKIRKLPGFRWSRPTSAVISINRLALNTCGYLPQRLQASVC
jgi:hypothetical protein